MTKAPARYVDRWQAAMLASDLDSGAKIIGVCLAGYADWQTGENARPAMRTLAPAAGIQRESAHRAMQRLAEAGWIERTGNAAHNVKTYRLVLSSCDPAVTTEPESSCDPDVTTGVPVVTSTRSRCDAGVTEPHQDRRSDDEDDARAASTDVPADALPSTVEVCRLLIHELTAGPNAPRAWKRSAIDAGHLVGLVAELIAAGWRKWELVDHLLTIGTPRQSATGLVAHHLKQLTMQDAEVWRATSQPIHATAEKVRRTFGDDVHSSQIERFLSAGVLVDLDDGQLLKDGRPTRLAATWFRAFDRVVSP